MGDFLDKYDTMEKNERGVVLMAHLIAAVATGGQKSAVGVVRLSGEGCFAALGKVFLPKNGREVSDLPDRKLTLGTLLDRDGRPLDEILATMSRGPNSYTGEDTAELQCHGSPAVLAEALSALFLAGARQAGPGEFTRRAFLNGKLDLSQAEAVMDLIDAPTAKAARNAAGQLSGALSTEINRIYDGITDILAHFHAVLDYSDEELPEFRLEEIREKFREYDATLAALEGSYHRGQYLKTGMPTVILGSPNAGKSSLLNLLAGYDRVIVTDIPGTTRDTVEETLLVGGKLLRLTDTAGIRDTLDPVEQQGVQRSRRAAEEAFLAFYVCDGAKPLTQDDRTAMEQAQKAPHVLAILNKCDLPQVIAPRDLPFDHVLTLSAREGTGLEALEEAVKEVLREPEEDFSGSLLTNARQLSAIVAARSCLGNALSSLDSGMTADCVLVDAEAALTALGEVTGRNMREDVVNRIFERFCVGK